MIQWMLGAFALAGTCALMLGQVAAATSLLVLSVTALAFLAIAEYFLDPLTEDDDDWT